MTTVTQRSSCARSTILTTGAAPRAVGPRPVPCGPVGDDVSPASPGPAALTVTVQRSAQGTRLQLDGELEVTTAPLLDCLVTDALDRPGGELLLDLTQTGFCDVKGLNCLLAARRSASTRGRHLSLIGAAPLLQHLLHLSGAADVIRPES